LGRGKGGGGEEGGGGGVRAADSIFFYGKGTENHKLGTGCFFTTV